MWLHSKKKHMQMDPSARQWQGRRRDWHNFKWIRVEGVKIIQNSRAESRSPLALAETQG